MPPSQSSNHRGPNPTVQLSEKDHAIMLRYALSPPTTRALTLLPRGADGQQILHCASTATEFRSFVFNPLEKGAFSAINNDPSTRWPVKVLSEPWHKVFLIAQCEAAGGDYGQRLSHLARQELLSTKPKIVKILGQVLRACADIMGSRKDAVGLRRTLELLRAVVSKS